MEQPEQSGHQSDTPGTVRLRRSNENLRSTINLTDDRTLPSPSSSPQTPSASVSSSVPTLRFPRPIGNRQLTNWVSSSSPDIMRNPSYHEEAPLDSSIADLGFEVIDNDGEFQSSSSEDHYDHPAHELADDVQSIADMTDTTGTDADTNELDSDSSEDDDEEYHSHSSPGNGRPSVADSHVDDMVHMADQSLEHPTELFTSTHLLESRSSSVSEDESLEGPAREPKSRREITSITGANSARDKVYKAGSDRTLYASATNHLGEWKELLAIWSKVVMDAFYRMSTRHILTRLLIVLIAIVGIPIISLLKPSQSQTSVISAVPAASVSSLRLKTDEPVAATTTAPASTPTTTMNALQTTNSFKSVAFMPFSKDNDAAEHVEPAVGLCTAEIHSRDAILIKVPQQVMSSWPAKQTVLVSVSRGPTDLDLQSTKVSPVDDGFLIQVPQEEAYGMLDVSIATTRKPKINETFHINFGNNLLGGALDAGKQLVKGFAQKVVDTVNGTTSWVEEACMPAFDLVSKQTSDRSISDSDLVLQGLREAGLAVIGVPARVSAQVIRQAKQILAKDKVSERLFQVETELVRQAQDVRDELSLGLLHAQLRTKLWWLDLQGKTEEHEEYTIAAKSYYRKKVDKATEARRARAAKTAEDIRTRQKSQKNGWKEGKRSFWEFGERGL